MPDGNVLTGFRTEDDGKRPLPKGVIEIERGFRVAVSTQKTFSDFALKALFYLTLSSPPSVLSRRCVSASRRLGPAVSQGGA